MGVCLSQVRLVWFFLSLFFTAYPYIYLYIYKKVPINIYNLQVVPTHNVYFMNRKYICICYIIILCIVFIIIYLYYAKTTRNTLAIFIRAHGINLCTYTYTYIYTNNTIVYSATLSRKTATVSKQTQVVSSFFVRGGTLIRLLIIYNILYSVWLQLLTGRVRRYYAHRSTVGRALVL